jgi:hypothetical protein
MWARGRIFYDWLLLPDSDCHVMASKVTRLRVSGAQEVKHGEGW